MNEKSGGWADKILRINVSDRSSRVIPTEAYSRRLLGGLGIAAGIAWDEIKPETGAFDADNKLIFATGPLTGTLAPGSGRMEVVGKSPRTFPDEVVTRSGMGGHWGVELKRAGYDAVILEGETDSPVYVYIDGNNVEFHDAEDVWGKDTYATQKCLKEKHGNKVQLYTAPIFHASDRANAYWGWGDQYVWDEEQFLAAYDLTEDGKPCALPAYGKCYEVEIEL